MMQGAIAVAARRWWSGALLAALAGPLALACVVEDLPLVGRPCSATAPCGPGLRCALPPGTCVLAAGDAGVDAPPPDHSPGEGGGELGPLDGRIDMFVIKPDAFAPPGSWVTIMAGSFTMGSPDAEPCRPVDGAPLISGKETQHTVTLTRAFTISAGEVTNRQFETVMTYYPPNMMGNISWPAMDVTWDHAAAYCNELSIGMGLSPCYQNVGSKTYCKDAQNSVCASGEFCHLKDKACHRYLAASAYSGPKIYSCPGFRLPTEAEWEYAYRAGSTSAYFSGQDPDPSTCDECTPQDPAAAAIAWYCGNGNSIRPPGQKAANAWGLHDMAGNVDEWCHDAFQDDLGSAPVTDPVGAGPDAFRVIRGGSVYARPSELRAAARIWTIKSGHRFATGFRCVRTIP